MCNKSENKGNVWIHFRYVVIILVAIIIVILSCRLSDNQEVTSIISFAGTVTSIILSVLAIFITVLSNDSMSGLMEKIRSLTDSVQPAAKQMDNASQNIETTITSLDTVREELKSASDKIQTASDKIEISTKGLSEKICGQIDEKFAMLRMQMQGGDNKLMDEHCQLNINYFLDNTSYWGIIILYTFMLCQEKSKKFHTDLFSTNFKMPISVEYVSGYFVASASAGYVGYEIINNNSLLKNIRVNASIEKKTLEDKIEQTNKDITYPIAISDIENLVNTFSKNE